MPRSPGIASPFVSTAMYSAALAGCLLFSTQAFADPVTFSDLAGSYWVNSGVASDVEGSVFKANLSPVMFTGEGTGIYTGIAANLNYPAITATAAAGTYTYNEQYTAVNSASSIFDYYAVITNNTSQAESYDFKLNLSNSSIEVAPTNAVDSKAGIYFSLWTNTGKYWNDNSVLMASNGESPQPVYSTSSLGSLFSNETVQTVDPSSPGYNGTSYERISFNDATASFWLGTLQPGQSMTLDYDGLAAAGMSNPAGFNEQAAAVAAFGDPYLLTTPQFSIQMAAVPEASNAAMMAAGLMLMAVVARRRQG